ncbi:18490_t:CDS:2 [Dentiscutata erythropus]|uniref:ATP-dependent DNA helicase n=1 Tax=Dentiscutata erythropus TaxID=1348616 RepID=A0A9N9A5J8_9GLOM|nr:18490_t:CDS:2 [Dentiscutata erythropus]
MILPCASTRIAILNYDRGYTAYLLFNIPVEYSEEGYKYQIKSNNKYAKLIQEASVIIWNELSIAQKVFIRIGNFRQVAPVVLNAKKTAMILESIKSSTI